MRIESRKVRDLKYYPSNPRIMTSEVLEKLKKSITEFGCVEPLVINENNEVIGGNQRLKAMWELGVDEVPVVIVSLSKSKEKALNLALNKIVGEWDYRLLADFVVDLPEEDIELTGFDDVELKKIQFDVVGGDATGNLSKKFIIPPFSVLDTRKAVWKERKQLWKNKYGDGLCKTKENLISSCKDFYSLINDGTSQFDPVLAEIIYRWFIPKAGGKILNPTCGEPCTGIIAGDLGLEYLGVDVRQEQIDINTNLIKEYGMQDKVKYVCHDSTNLNDLGLARDFDLVFYSPPYYNLEVYSQVDKDISREISYDEFMKGYYKVMKNACDLLKDNRFFVMKLGDVRETQGQNKGVLCNFIGDTISYGQSLGMRFYNDMVLVTMAGTACIRASQSFKLRKLVRTHQRVIVFYKGNDFSNIKEDFGEVYIDKELEEVIRSEIESDGDTES